MYEDHQLICRKCSEAFTIREFSPNALGDLDRWPLECPHCGETTVEKSAGYFEVIQDL
ncbi:hypothetical protein ACR3H8_32545 [Pseudomonas aeruginosa]|jgi:Zn finger protein HypA/HybF involved in hydrogenase expression|uniref:Uncharacterized protein n=2 Tax=Pseudomonas TaxID=286 RepID=A0A2L1KDP1_PSEAI|nr:MULTISPECIES: hypothetical protein [Pseudomonas]ASU52216.1 Hypothetical protein [Pseudomonas putida]AVE20441.1 Hypothetical protein [Pseudomonas aeruginosa]AVE21540.1 Hypothetical protein [Pseudomonas aeruginosa]AVE22029.1 Hypothetical protein [Pseudomonas aeruginosa]EKW4789827.1 hypothetical protein [Pseudomonas aeruginosa]